MMFTQTGYYSIIQYCPDRTRMETANLGVLLFCPGWEYLNARIVASFRRLGAFFARQDFDPKRLGATLGSLKSRLETSKKDFHTREDMERFIATRANDLSLTPLRSIKVDDPEKELNSLYSELFGRKRAEAPGRVPLIPELDAVFRRPSILPKIELDVELPLPWLGQVFRAPYAYRNGALNLVRPERLPRMEGAAANRVERLALEGDQLQKHPGDDGMSRRLILVLQPPEGGIAESFIPRAESLLGEYKIRVLSIAQVGDLAQEIEMTAR